MIGKLGYVPPEVRQGGDGSNGFDTDNVTAADRVKYRSRKRAKKASPLVKIGIGAIVLIVVAGIAGGIIWLSGEDESDNGTGLTFAEVEKPCDHLDTSALSGVSGADKVKPMRDEVNTKKNKSEQICEVTLGDEGSVGSVQVYSEVFPRNAGAENAFDHGAKDAEESASETVSYQEVDGVGDDAFAVTRMAGEGSETIDYSLYLHQDNAFLYTRVSLFAGASEAEVVDYAKQIAESYLTGWQG